MIAIYCRSDYRSSIDDRDHQIVIAIKSGSPIFLIASVIRMAFHSTTLMVIWRMGTEQERRQMNGVVFISLTMAENEHKSVIFRS